MQIILAATPSNKDNDTILSIKVDFGEKISVGDYIDIELMDGKCIKKRIETMRRWVLKEGAKRGKWISIDYIEDGQSCEVYISGIYSNIIRTISMPSRQDMERWERIISITPYKEIIGGEESIYDNLDKEVSVPDKVIEYLKVGKCHVAGAGIYEHPFIKGKMLAGPYICTDNTYCWDMNNIWNVIGENIKSVQKETWKTDCI